jgi:hypothetical protein
MHWHPTTLQLLGKLRADELLREAEEWRAALLAAQPIPRHRGGLADALAWWRSRLLRGRVEKTPLAEQEQP